MLMVLEETCVSEAMNRARGWKLFLLLPRMFLHRPSRGGTKPQEQIGSDLTDSDVGSGQNFCGEGPLMTLLHVQSAQALVMMGEISSGSSGIGRC